MINLNRPTCDDDAIVRQSRIVAFDANARAEKRKADATPARNAAKLRFEQFDQCELEDPDGSGGVAYVFEADCRQIKSAKAAKPVDDTPDALADMIADCTPVSGAALVGTKPPFKAGDLVMTKFDGLATMVHYGEDASTVRLSNGYEGIVSTGYLTLAAPQPDADGWIPFECTKDSVCPVPGGTSFEIKLRCGEYFDATGLTHIRWLALALESHREIVAYRILNAKPAALPGWRRGPDVPYDERNSGLWFFRLAGDKLVIPAEPAGKKSWSPDCEYRPAPPGVREGDAYSPALYGEEA